MRGRAALAGCLFAVSCDAAHDGRFEGVPALTLEGQLVVVGDGATPVWGDGAGLDVMLQWHTSSQPGSLVSQPVRVELRFPDAMRVVLMDPPPDSARTLLPAMSGPIAFGQLVVFEDLDGNEAWSRASEPLFGVSTAAIVFAESPASGPRLAVPAGFSFVRLGGCRGEDGFGGRPVDGLRVALFPEARAPFEPLDGGGLIAGHCEARSAYVCQGLADRRPACVADPSLPACRACPLGVYPEGADVTECELWRNGCAFHPDYDPDECESQWAECVCQNAAGGACDARAIAAAGR